MVSDPATSLPATRPRHAAWVPGGRLDGVATPVNLPDDAPLVGVLALQGDVHEHEVVLNRVGARVRRVRRAEHLDGLDGIVVPGGESTTIGKMLRRFDLLDDLAARLAGGLPALGTCAGMILLSRELDQDFDQPLLGVLGVRTRRNAFGRQVDSFDTSLDVAGIDGGPVDVSFIRAPVVVEVLDDDVEVLAAVDLGPVVVRQRNLLATSFHPEVTGDDRLHAGWVATLGS
nr:pyridoxal 5'-phosphate synthase glutaminase subunit PdxT [Salsipaludibacter albus]